MITAIIIDDEKHCIDRLERVIDTNLKEIIDLKGSFQTIEDGFNAIHKINPSLIFLDVEINGKTGFDLLKQLTKINFEVIFTTAHDKYAVQAFKFSAIDYLLKPINTDELKAAVSKLSDKMNQSDLSRKLDVLYHNFKNMNGVSKKICVPVLKGFVFLEVSDIVWCESNINYTTLFLKNNEKLLVAKTLKEFEELLTDHNFYRIHNSYLINLSCIKSYNKGKGGSVVMNDGSEIEVSTRRKEEFLRAIASL